MAGHRTSTERELEQLAGELRALDEDIADARAASARARSSSWLHRHDEPPPPRLQGERVRLSDGAEILIRPVEPEDAPWLELGLEHLSAMARYQRFRAPIAHFTREQLDELTRVNHRTHEALAALDPAKGDGVGIARYICRADDPTQADVYCVIADAWTHRGVGGALLERLAARAREEGVEQFIATTLVGNVDARRLLAHVAEPLSERRDGGLIWTTARLRDVS